MKLAPLSAVYPTMVTSREPSDAMELDALTEKVPVTVVVISSVVHSPMVIIKSESEAARWALARVSFALHSS